MRINAINRNVNQFFSYIKYKFYFKFTNQYNRIQLRNGYYMQIQLKILFVQGKNI